VKAFWKDIYREILKSFGRYVSLIIITALGAAAVAGILATSINMRAVADKTFKERALYDIQIKSTTGFDENDVSALRNIPGVNTVMPTSIFDIYVHFGNDTRTIRAFALPDGLNHIELLDGSLPAAANECIVERALLRQWGLKIGDTLTFGLDNMDDYHDIFAYNELTVTGTVKAPFFIIPYDRGNTSRGDGRLNYYMYLHPDTFELDVYTDVFVLMDSSLQIDNLSEEYRDTADEWVRLLKQTGSERVRVKTDEFTDAQVEINDGWLEYYDGFAQLEDEVAEGLRELLDAEIELEDARVKLEDARLELEDAQRKLDDAPVPEWFFFTREDNAAFDSYYQDTRRLEGIGYVFPIVFFIVAVLVSLTTMSRMVDEQRTQIGIYKALGYPAPRIIVKFLLYAFSASVIGGWTGVFIGSSFFPRVIYGAYMHMYDMPPIETPVPVMISLIAVSVSVAIVMFVTVMSCYRSMRCVPAEMMRPVTPPAGKKVLFERIPFIWNRMKFTSKVTARNIFRYKKRFIMTLAGVSGCTAILITSFGLQDSLAAISDLQYDKLVTYKLRAYHKEITSEEQRIELDTLISGERLFIREESLTAEGSAFSVSLIVPESADFIGDFINFYSRSSGDRIRLESSGVLITEKLARELDISRGDLFTFSAGESGTFTVNITGVVENYVMHHVYMPPGLYFELFGEPALFNSVLIATDEDAATKLVYNSNVRAVVFTSNLRDNTADATDAMNIVALVLIFLACALALVVLFNLTNINITERIRELATIKVLGFYNEELSMYIYRENSIVTLMGVALGLFLGIFLHGYVLMAAEIDMLMFPRIIRPWSFVYSAGLTIVFAVFVNLVMNVKLARIDMVESLKNVE